MANQEQRKDKWNTSRCSPTIQQGAEHSTTFAALTFLGMDGVVFVIFSY